MNMKPDALVLEANKLVIALDNLLWDLSMSGNADLFERVNSIHWKALERYERRYKKWKSLPENRML